MTRDRTPPNKVSDSLEFSVEQGVAYPLYPILVVDDEPENLQAFKLNFQGDFTIHTAESGLQALEMLKEREYAVLVSDQRMPGMTGVELLQKTVADYPQLVRIVLTGFTDHSSLIDAINYARIYQYITKPWKAEELSITLKRAIERYAVEVHNRRLTEALRRSKEEVEEQLRRSMRDLKRANERLRKLATSDGLTGLYNHRYFQERWRREIKRARRYSEPLSLMIIDVDHFKTYNDTLGHPQGDALLREMANLLVASVREVDLVARYGGDEFVIVLPKAPKEAAMALGERIRARVEAHEFPNRSVLPRGHLSTSIGVATFPEDGSGPSEVIQAADDGLYVAKKAGRNTVAEAPPTEDEPQDAGSSEESRRKKQAAAKMAAEAAVKEAEAAQAARAAAAAAREAADAAARAASAAREAAEAAEADADASDGARKPRRSSGSRPGSPRGASRPGTAKATAAEPDAGAAEAEEAKAEAAAKPARGKKASAKANGKATKAKRGKGAREPTAGSDTGAKASTGTAAGRRKQRKAAGPDEARADATFEGDGQGIGQKVEQAAAAESTAPAQLAPDDSLTAADLPEPEALDVPEPEGVEPFFQGAMDLGRDGGAPGFGPDDSSEYSLDILSEDGLAAVGADALKFPREADSVVTQRRVAVLDSSFDDDDDMTQPLLKSGGNRIPGAPGGDPDASSSEVRATRLHNVAGALEAFEDVELALEGDADEEPSEPVLPAVGSDQSGGVEADGQGGIVVTRGGDPDDDEEEEEFTVDARRRHQVADAGVHEIVVERGDEEDPGQSRGGDRSADEEFVLAIDD